MLVKSLLEGLIMSFPEKLKKSSQDLEKYSSRLSKESRKNTKSLVKVINQFINKGYASSPEQLEQIADNLDRFIKTAASIISSAQIVPSTSETKPSIR